MLTIAKKIKEPMEKKLKQLGASEDAKAIKARASDFQEATGSLLTEVGGITKELSLKFLAGATKTLQKRLTKRKVKLRNALETTQAAKAKRRENIGV
ncbi:hypothetical protein KAR91_06840 [Candidatus Pacearchaeota archaeon]|nr:hypothetical protein [Candidatus Pacearchaeota archaeon]